MPNSLIIVESPTKVKTIKKYLGSEFDVRASVGHVKDLPGSALGIDIEHDFSPTYEVLEAKKKVIAELKKAAKTADTIYLAPDPDREGEAIAWHIADEIGTKGKQIYRVLFNDLTKNTILAAIKNPLPLDRNRYEAQQTRRILDRLVGYQISPILWNKVQYGLSAGRVQSVAVRIVCEREQEILNFKPEEYWNITAALEGANPPPFEAKLVKIGGKKAKVGNDTQAAGLVETLKTSAFTVSGIESKETKRNPLPPFTTSKLQQEASRWLHFSPKKTMMIAQKLYEGIELGKEGPVGLITYMRTDSVRVAGEALSEARTFIQDVYGKDFLPAKAKVYATSDKAQDAHEAIRPSSLAYRPAEIKQYLSSDQFRLYQLIWNRFVASQMNPALFDQTIVDITAADCLFQVRGTVLKFAGFTILYTEGKDTDDENGNGKNLPKLSEKEVLKTAGTQARTALHPAPAPLHRGHAGAGARGKRHREAQHLRRHPEHHPGAQIREARTGAHPPHRSRDPGQRAAGAELSQDHGRGVHGLHGKPARPHRGGEAQPRRHLEGVLHPLRKRSEKRRQEDAQHQEGIRAHRRGLRQVRGPHGDPVGPQRALYGLHEVPRMQEHPERQRDKNGNGGAGAQAEAKPTDIACEKCGKPMNLKEGRFGKFLGCSGYPECKSTMPLSTGVACPEEGCKGSLAEKRTKKGKSFYGCSKYPSCKYAIWDRPIAEECPQCGSKFLVEKYNRKTGRMKACPKEGCTFKEAIS